MTVPRKLRGSLSLGGRFAGALSRLAVDRIGEALGTGLPRTAAQLANVDILEGLLRDHAPEGAAPLPSVSEVRLSGVTFESSNCTNFLVDVAFEGGEGQGLPTTLYAKLPCSEIGTRAFANAIGFWEVETHFCEQLAARVPIRVPRVHAAVRNGTRFVLLLENLHETPGVRLFINRDMAAGTTPERARLCLQTFAELHAGFWGMSRLDREALLPLRLHTYLSPGGAGRTRVLNAAAIAPAHAAAPDLFTAAHVDLCRLAIDKWDALMEAWYREPLTLIHGDSHLANCFEYPTAAGPRVGLIDFQGLQWCQGIRDVQYHLINSLEPDLLAAHEEALIDFYVGEIGRRGIDLDPGEARVQYRAFSFQTLMVAVVSLGLGSLTERDETVRTVLRRSIAAVDRLEFGDWLCAL